MALKRKHQHQFFRWLKPTEIYSTQIYHLIFCRQYESNGEAKKNLPSDLSDGKCKQRREGFSRISHYVRPRSNDFNLHQSIQAITYSTVYFFCSVSKNFSSYSFVNLILSPFNKSITSMLNSSAFNS